MTAVASPPSVQSGPRLGWYNSGNEGQGAVSSMSADEVSRILMQRKTLQRSSSSSSLGSTSSTSTVSPSPPSSHAGQSSNPDSGTWSSSKKKPSRNPWPSSKSEPVSGVTNARPQAVSSFSSGPTASSTMSAIHQPSSIVPSQHMLQSPQQNGVRGGNASSGDPPTLLTLVPTNGTFERKHINVPYYPEVLRVGRQTNAKTVPTPVNGYFDSKVLSRQHAEIWADKGGKIWIRDVKSSNGTFVNGQRLSPENRESEAHEVRENDTLELGIDIVSEDQKTIVHHKVSAKVEHAGVYGNGVPNILDLNFGDLDPASGSGLLPSPLSQPVSHPRGRSGSNMSSRSAQSAASGQFNAMHQQRQMNYWNSPISVEQVVKRLTSEMAQAKQQSQDLRQTDDFLATIMKPGYMEKEKAKHSQPEVNPSRQVNGRPKMPRVDSFSRFSDPPAPPPQQPLPEKPDALPRNSVDLMSPLKRSETEKQKPSAHSPASRESSQILSLIEALSSAKRELDSQGARVKELESLLLQERSARESAEAKARNLEARSGKQTQESEVAAAFEPPTDAHHEDVAVPRRHEKTVDSDISAPAMTDAVSKEATAMVDGHTTKLQRRLETVVGEMEEMRQQVAVFKDRAYKAEDESAKTRKSLAEMIESLRRERGQDGESEASKSPYHAHDSVQAWETTPSCLEDHGIVKDFGHAMTTSPTKEGEEAATAFAAERGKHGLVEQSSPYASMLGVVLLGVGLMAYLNGWQKMER